MDEQIKEIAFDALNVLKSKGKMLATAESCTGGMIAASLTDIAGSSAVLDCGFVTYSNDAKTAMVGVDPALIEENGAVSEPVARAMAEGALSRSKADIAVSVTGIAGPDGGSAEKPVGTVHFAVAQKDAPTRHLHMAFADEGRAHIRGQSVICALTLVLEALED